MRETPKNRQWMIGRKGEHANAYKHSTSYHAIHNWLAENFVKPDKCERCGKSEVSRLEWANISGKYLRERDDFMVLCPSCHRKMDLKKDYCKNGHPRNSDNCFYGRNGWIVCRQCLRDANKRYRRKQCQEN